MGLKFGIVLPAPPIPHYLKMREALLPKGIEELFGMIDSHEDAVIYAGGTDALVRLLNGPCMDSIPLICLERVPELYGITEDDEVISIGACTTLSDVVSSSIINSHLPLLSKACKSIGSPLIRNMGTIGGNICTASPAGDSLPALYALDAEVEIMSSKGSYIAPLQGFITGAGKTTLKKGELLYAIHIKKHSGYQINHFEKVGLRRANAISVASMASIVRLDSGGIIRGIRCAWGSVAPTVFTSREIERMLIGSELNMDSLKEASGLVSRAVSPIDDIRASANYRRLVAGRLLFRLITYNRADAA